MRYLLNYKGTTLPFQADRVKNWLLYSSLRFFSIPLSRRVMYSSVGEIHLSDTQKCPAPQKPLTIQRTDMNGSNGRGSDFLQHGIQQGGLSAAMYVLTSCYMNKYGIRTHTHTHTHKDGQTAAAAGGVHSGINLHPTEICVARRLRGGR